MFGYNSSEEFFDRYQINATTSYQANNYEEVKG
jgi:hypothetical protein